MWDGQAAALFRDEETDVENPRAVSRASMLLSQEYNFSLTAFCSEMEKGIANLKLMIGKSQYSTWLKSPRGNTYYGGSYGKNHVEWYGQSACFHMAFLVPRERRLISSLLELMFCTLILTLCSSGLILCRSNFSIVRCVQGDMLWFIKGSVQHYFSETTSRNGFLFVNLWWIRKDCRW